MIRTKGVTRGTVSDINGYYELKVTDGDAVLTFSYLGYETLSVPVKVDPGEFLTRDVSLRTSSNMMDEVVVSVGRYEQKLSDITVSMELLKSERYHSSVSERFNGCTEEYLRCGRNGPATFRTRWYGMDLWRG